MAFLVTCKIEADGPIKKVKLEGRTSVLIASVPGHCLRFTFCVRVLVVVLCVHPKSLPIIRLMLLLF